MRCWKIKCEINTLSRNRCQVLCTENSITTTLDSMKIYFFKSLTLLLNSEIALLANNQLLNICLTRKENKKKTDDLTLLPETFITDATRREEASEQQQCNQDDSYSYHDYNWKAPWAKKVFVQHSLEWTKI